VFLYGWFADEKFRVTVSHEYPRKTRLVETGIRSMDGRVTLERPHGNVGKKRSGTRYFGTGADFISIIVSKVDKIPAAHPSSLVLIHFVPARDNRQVNRG